MTAKKFAVALMLIILILTCTVPVFALEYKQAYLTSYYGDEDYWIGRQFEICDKPLESTFFTSFDINSKGEIAVGYYNGSQTVPKCWIGVYDSDGHFKYSIDLKNDRGIETVWIDDQLTIIYTYRSERAIILDNDLHVIKVKKYHEPLLNRTNIPQREYNGYIYAAADIDGNVAASNYNLASAIVRIDSDGNKKTLLSMSRENYTLSLAEDIFLLIMMFAPIVLEPIIIPIVVVRIVKNKRKKAQMLALKNMM